MIRILGNRLEKLVYINANLNTVKSICTSSFSIFVRPVLERNLPNTFQNQNCFPLVNPVKQLDVMKRNYAKGKSKGKDKGKIFS